ncbi:putative bifunctional diguanylate cyclase/phosphodiesterase [Inhella sp.]|uniref:putative bifunctional diguanylate cyclase/phosphodiesterase n=1 Tax=Inhella sp. TaxID=1921806 RepID=UPI0035B2E32D
MNDPLRLNELQRLALDEAARFRLLADNVPVLIALYQRDDYRCLYANRRYAQTFGKTPESVVGRTVAEIIGEEAASLIQPQVDRVVQRRESVSYERVLQGPDGLPQWIEVNLLPHVDSQGQVQGAFVLISDITKHRRAEAALRDSEARLEKFMLATVEGIVFHRGGTVTDVNQSLCQLLGYSREELIGRFVLDFVADSERVRVGQVMREAQEIRYESVLLRRGGEPLSVELIARTMVVDGEKLRMNVVRDIRDRLAAQARIRHLALHDPLTGLMNRSAFLEYLEAALRSARRERRSLGLLFIDLNNFKRVNDSLGHLEGDRVLVTVAERLRACLRVSDQVARFGGDEFVVLLDGLHGREDVLVVLQALLNVVEVPVQAHGRTLSVTPSIGIALYPEHGDSADVLIQHADTAMYEAKRRGGKEYQFFTPKMAETAYAELVIESQLTDALTRGEFVLYYQPQVEPSGERLVGAEALLRWQHPERGLLSPDAFIAVAERSPLMVPLSQWVLREAALQARRWHDSSVASVPIAVNLSHIQFRLQGFVETVRQVLEEVSVPGQWLQLELTERMMMDDLPAVKATLTGLRELGLSIAVDDFGTGHTALAHLTQLPLDKLKVDQSFVLGIGREHGASAVTQAIVQMARGLGLCVGAEGVRDRAQVECLLEWGCDEVQGDWVAPPMSVDEFERWAGKRANTAQ